MKPKYYHLDDGIRFFLGPELNEGQDLMRTIAAFRGNAAVRITGVAKDKVYRLKLCGHDNKELPPIEVVAAAGDKEADICRKLVSALNAQRSIAAAIFDAPNQIILSPIVASSDVVRIKTNGQSVKPAVVFINGAEFTLQNANAKTLQKSRQ